MNTYEMWKFGKKLRLKFKASISGYLYLNFFYMRCLIPFQVCVKRRKK